MKEVTLVAGFPGAGKTQLTESRFPSHYRLNRDTEGGSISGLAKKLKEVLANGENKIVLDNTFGTKKSREDFIKYAKAAGAKVNVIWLNSTIEQAQFNAAHRQIKKYNRLLSLEEMKQSKDPGNFPVAALFAYQKSFEEPTKEEGIDHLEIVKFKRELGPDYKNKALILDYDSTLRETKNGDNYPAEVDNITILPRRKEIITGFKDKGYILAGVSNQSGIGSEKITRDQAVACFEKTNEMLGLDIDYQFCPHGKFPIACLCRKPMPGLGVFLVEKYKLVPADCIMVGDKTSDQTFAKRCGFKFEWTEDFFKDKK